MKLSDHLKSRKLLYRTRMRVRAIANVPSRFAISVQEVEKEEKICGEETKSDGFSSSPGQLCNTEYRLSAKSR